MRMKEFLKLDGTDMANLVRQNEVTPDELLELAIERSNHVNPSVNAMILTMYEEARETIQKNLGGEYFGVPFLLKDLGETYKGVRITSGSKIFKNYIAPTDSELVIRYKQAGLITFGKTNTPEFGLLPTTEPELFGPCRNPWNLGLISGGSSGGAAASVASGIAPIAHGSDGGGSIRTPSSCCGVFGLKPTRGRTPMIPNLSGLIVSHVLTKSVRDSAKILDITSKPFHGTPHWVPPPKRPYIEELRYKQEKLRIAYSVDTLTGTEVHKDCIDALDQTVKLCQELGHKVTEASPNLENFASLATPNFLIIWTSLVDAMFKEILQVNKLEITKEMVEPFTWAFYEHGKKFSGGDYLNVVSFFQQMTYEIAKFYKNYDLFLTPTLGEPPVPLKTFEPPKDDLMKAIDRIITFMPFTGIWNATGQPAMSIPLYWNSKKIPIGTQFIAKFGDESTLFNIAGQLEVIKPWKDQFPDL